MVLVQECGDHVVLKIIAHAKVAPGQTCRLYVQAMCMLVHCSCSVQEHRPTLFTLGWINVYGAA